MNFQIILFISLAGYFADAAINWQTSGTVQWAMGCDFNGNDLQGVASKGEECGGLCTARSDCTHFSWTSYSGGTCWLKKGSVTTANAVESSQAGIVCGVARPSTGVNWSNGDWAPQCDFPKASYASVDCLASECGGACAKDPSCSHYSWTSNSATDTRGKCWLKSGSVQKSDATPTTYKTMVCGVVSSSQSTTQPPLTGDRVPFSIINNCPYDIYVGFWGKSRSDANYIKNLPYNGGWKLSSGQRTEITTPKDLDSARIWGRTGCSTVNGQFTCETGSCGPFVDCANGGVARTGAPPATLAEFTLNGSGNQDFYDVSLVDGYNVQMSIKPKSPNGSGNEYWCKNQVCLSDLNSICPAELQKKNSAGKVVACYSACEHFQTDVYCCRGAHNTPQTCQSWQWPVNYPALFKKACPQAYSYAYDDNTSTYFCRNTGYDVVFC